MAVVVLRRQHTLRAMARTTRSAATERAYLHFAPTSPLAGTGEDFDESDIWGAFAPSAAAAPAAEAAPPRARPFVLAAAAGKATTKPAAPAHGSLPVKIPDWSKILGDEYRPAGYHHGWDWEVDDADDDGSVDALVPPHELACRRRAASLSVNGVVGRTLKVRDAVWKRTTGFQD